MPLFGVGETTATRGGCPVRIIAVDARSDAGPIVGLVMGGPDYPASWRGELVRHFYDNGTCDGSSDFNGHIYDLVDADASLPRFLPERYDTPATRSRSERVERAQKIWNESGDAISAMLNFADHETGRV